MKLRIFYVAPFPLEDQTGGALHARGSVEALEAAGVHVRVLCPSSDNSSVLAHAVTRIPQLKRSGFYAPSFGLALAAWIAPEVMRWRPDVIYSRYFDSLLLPQLSARAVGVPTVVEVNSDLANERRAARRGRLKSRVTEAHEYAVYRAAAGVVAVSPGVEASIRKRFPSLSLPVRVIENGVDLALYRPFSRVDSCRRHGLDPDGRHIVFAGTLQSWQGVKYLVAAAPDIARRSGATILIIGDGPERSSLESLAAEMGVVSQVRFLGARSAEETASWLGAADVCVAPYDSGAWQGPAGQSPARGSLLRGSPLKVMTYLASARPVVATHYREAGELVKKVGAGASVPPDDAPALAEAISSILQGTEGAAMGRRGREFVEAEFGWTTVTRRLTDFLTEVAEQRRDPAPRRIESRV